MPVTAPADKRFLRAHVRPIRRRASWHTVVLVGRRVALASLFVFGVWRLGAMVAGAPEWRIDHITVSGAERLTRGEVRAIIADLRGQSILRADLDAARRRLLESPWVADAVLRRRLPASVDVSIVERRPMGIGRISGTLFLIDEQGVVIDAYGPKYAELDLPIIDGLAAPGQMGIEPQRMDLASRLLASLAGRPDIARRVSQVDVSDASDAVVLLDTDAALLRVGDRQFRERLENYLELAPALRERVASIDYVDLRYGSHVFVGTGGKSAAPSPAGTAGGR